MRRSYGHLLFAFLIAVAVLISLGGSSFAIDGNEMFEDPVKEARARDVGRQLRCLVCQNQSIFDSNSGLAKDLRVLVRSRMDKGDTDSQILSYIAERYGDYVLLQPRFSMKNAALWAAPPVALLIGLLVMVLYLRSRNGERREITLTEDERQSARKLLQEGKS